MIDGKRVDLSDETVQNIKDQLGEKKEYLMKKKGDKIYWANSNGKIYSYETSGNAPLLPFESLNRKTLERAAKFIQLQNFADEVNGEFSNSKWHIRYDYTAHVTWAHKSYLDGGVYFSSEEAAQKAIDYFGEDFFKEYVT